MYYKKAYTVLHVVKLLYLYHCSDTSAGKVCSIDLTAIDLTRAIDVCGLHVVNVVWII